MGLLDKIKRIMTKITLTTKDTSNVYHGKSLTINNSCIIIDGNDVTPQLKNISISIEGNIEKIDVDACNYINVSGSVHTITNGSGDINCGNITGNVKTASGDIECGDVAGDINVTSGDVKVITAKGKISTVSGDITATNVYGNINF